MTDDSIYARLLLQKDAVNKWMERCGVRFGIYKNGKLILTATTSKEAQPEIDDIER